MIVVHRRFGPKYSEHERVVYGSTNRTGHAGCWINDVVCDDPNCIMADLDSEAFELELEGTTLEGVSE